MDSREVYEKCEEFYEKAKKHPKIWIGFGILFAVVLLIWLPPWRVSHFEINNATVEADLENQYRATLAQILGGVAIGITLYYTWRRIAIAEEELSTSKEGQITERFTRAIEQLGTVDQSGNPAIEIRLGGIYALERISKESGKDYWSIIEILTAYVRKNSCTDKDKRKKVGHKGQYEASIDIQTILTVIGKYEHSYNSELINSIDLHNTCLRGVKLRDGHLEGANLIDANLNYTFLRGSHLEGAYLIDATLICSILFEAHLEDTHLEGAHLGSADLEEAYLNGAYFDGVSFANTKLKKAYFKNAHLKGAKNLTIDQLSMVKTLYKAELDPELEEELRSKGYSHLLDDEP
jgi:hypothetical protein